MVAIDSLFYGRLTVTPWNIIAYNLLPSGDSAKGPELYGTEPWYYYIFNLALAFNIILPLALASLPALFVTYMIDRRRLGLPASKDQSSQYTVLGLRLLPVYLWLGVLTAQPHKEERFGFPAYTMICFNAAVTVYLIRGWMETAYIKITASPYRVRLVQFGVLAQSTHLRLCRLLAARFSALLPSPLSHTPPSSPSPASSRSGTTTMPRFPLHTHLRPKNSRVYSTSLAYCPIHPQSHATPDITHIMTMKSAWTLATCTT